jgi:hypothetical protein
MIRVILKVDDFWGKEREVYFLNKVIENKIKISLGIVGVGLENSSFKIIDLIKNNLDIIQPFNHSYQHLLTDQKKEFFKTSSDYQRESIDKTNKIIKEKLGFNVKTIGFVANACDEKTIEIIKESNLDNVYYVKGSYNYEDVVATGKKIINIELEDKLTVFQIHPFTWSEEQVDAFINSLKEEDYQFIFPNEI